jgi:hypothetical protein
MLRSAPKWVQLAVVVSLQWAAGFGLAFAAWRSWPFALAWGADMTAVLWGTSWWDRWRERQLDIQEGLRPASDVRWRGRRLRPWVRQALATYAVAFGGCVLVVVRHWRSIGWGMPLSAVIAAGLTGLTVCLYNRGLRGSPDGPTLAPRPKSRVRA